MNRAAMVAHAQARTEPWDMIVVGGGATGVGVAIDGASRGYDVLLLERSDFGKGTSSRSTKLVHGGVRYLEQGNISLVMEALKERGMLRSNAPHLVHDLGFVVPNYDWWETPFYGFGLKVYNLLAGKYGFGASRILSREETVARLPTIRTEGLRGGVIYFDGQFDDARLLINMAQTAVDQGATLLNYAPVLGLLKDAEGFVNGVRTQDAESGAAWEARARVVVNATGAFCDALRLEAEPEAVPMIAASQGIHLVFDRSFLPGDSAIMVPHTSDGRVMFAIPWHGHTLVGTTDTPIPEATIEPRAQEQEIDFVLITAGEYLAHVPTREDILSVWTGIRPLVKSGTGSNTAALSRDHTIQIDRSGLLTVTGGKWTTYRHMAEDCVNQAATLGSLAERACTTRTLNIHGYHQNSAKFGDLAVYGADAAAISGLQQEVPQLSARLHPDLPYTAAEVVFAVREECARTVEDVLARRLRALFLNSHAAVAMAPAVARLMAAELSFDEQWCASQVALFQDLALAYMV